MGDRGGKEAEKKKDKIQKTGWGPHVRRQIFPSSQLYFRISYFLFAACRWKVFSNFQVILVISRFSFILAPCFGLGAPLRFSRLVWLFLYGLWVSEWVSVKPLKSQKSFAPNFGNFNFLKIVKFWDILIFWLFQSVFCILIFCLYFVF